MGAKLGRTPYRDSGRETFGSCFTAIGPDHSVDIRSLRDGVLVQGKSFMEMMKFRPETIAPGI